MTAWLLALLALGGTFVLFVLIVAVAWFETEARREVELPDTSRGTRG